MNTRMSYLPSHAQSSSYGAMGWPRNPISSYANPVRGSYARNERPAYAPRVAAASRPELSVIEPVAVASRAA